MLSRIDVLGDVWNLLLDRGGGDIRYVLWEDVVVVICVDGWLFDIVLFFFGMVLFLILFFEMLELLLEVVNGVNLLLMEFDLFIYLFFLLLMEDLFIKLLFIN